MNEVEQKGCTRREVDAREEKYCNREGQILACTTKEIDVSQNNTTSGKEQEKVGEGQGTDFKQPQNCGEGIQASPCAIVLERTVEKGELQEHEGFSSARRLRDEQEKARGIEIRSLRKLEAEVDAALEKQKEAQEASTLLRTPGNSKESVRMCQSVYLYFCMSKTIHLLSA